MIGIVLFFSCLSERGRLLSSIMGMTCIQPLFPYNGGIRQVWEFPSIDHIVANVAEQASIAQLVGIKERTLLLPVIVCQML